MTDPTRPFLVLYIVWHPGYVFGAEIAETLRKHFRSKLFENIAGGTGLSVIFRFAPVPGLQVPLPIDFSESETTAVIVLTESKLVGDPDWVAYIQEIVRGTNAAGLGSRVFSVAMEPAGLDLGLVEQALLWHRWKGTEVELLDQLIRQLTYEFCRMLRHYLAYLSHPKEEEEALLAYLKKVQIFLSHSKHDHDDDGTRIAKMIRDSLQAGNGLASFFDVNDIPAGVAFDKVLLLQVKMSAVVAIHTDSYSSREWCRREIIEAKRWNVPLVVVNCISDQDERGFPYMGNVPVVRMDPHAPDRIDYVIGRLLDEVLKDFLWRCQVVLSRPAADPRVIFLPRPPELISLAGLPATIDVPHPIIVYPDPPLGAEEQRLFERVAPNVQLLSLSEWQAGALS